MHIAEARRRLDTKMPWLSDSMSNELKHAFGDRNNSEFVIGADGKIAVARSWSDPDQLRKDLEQMVGKVDKITTVADLKRKSAPAAKRVAGGVVKKIEKPENLEVVKVLPKMTFEKDREPFYVKLRAEAERSLLTGGKGKLVLGFHLDPLYHVHWNNLAEPLKYKIAVPEGYSVTPSSGSAAKVEVEADSDPREFVLDVARSGAETKMVLKVDYFACDDEQKWCKAVSQEYTITFERDRDAGRVMSGRRGGGGPGGDPGAMLERLLGSDSDGDGKISRKEAPERLAERFDQFDSDGDGFLTKSELEARFKRRGPPRR